MNTTETSTTPRPDLALRLANDLDGAFPDFVAAYQDPLFGSVLRLVGHRHDAEDITQETFVRAYRALAGYPTDRIETLLLRGWLWTIALNMCRNRARDAGRRPRLEALDPSDAPLDHATGPEAQAVTADEIQRWSLRLATLTDVQRTAVVLRHVGGLSYEEIATATGRAVGTVKADVHRGLNRLRSMMTNEEGHSP